MGKQVDFYLSLLYKNVVSMLIIAQAFFWVIDVDTSYPGSCFSAGIFYNLKFIQSMTHSCSEKSLFPAVDPDFKMLPSELLVIVKSR